MTYEDKDEIIARQSSERLLALRSFFSNGLLSTEGQVLAVAILFALCNMPHVIIYSHVGKLNRRRKKFSQGGSVNVSK